MDRNEIGIGILGGFGLGLLLGSEFSGTIITLIGAGCIVVFIFAIIALSVRK